MSGLPHNLLQPHACEGFFNFNYVFWGALSHEDAALVTAFGTHVDEVVAALDDVEVVLDDEDSVALFDETLQDFEEASDVVEVKTGCWFVQYIESSAR